MALVTPQALSLTQLRLRGLALALVWGAVVGEKRPTPCLWSSRSRRKTHRQTVTGPEIIIEYRAGRTAGWGTAALDTEKTLPSECCRAGELSEGPCGQCVLGSRRGSRGTLPGEEGLGGGFRVQAGGAALLWHCRRVPGAAWLLEPGLGGAPLASPREPHWVLEWEKPLLS